MVVRFTAWAEHCLKEIFTYYREEAGEEKAFEIIGRIIARAETLEKHPKRGQTEEDLRALGKGHRYLLEYHYKIIYRIEGETVIITDIFSTRQNPQRKIKRNK